MFSLQNNQKYKTQPRHYILLLQYPLFKGNHDGTYKERNRKTKTKSSLGDKRKDRRENIILFLKKGILLRWK